MSVLDLWTNTIVLNPWNRFFYLSSVIPTAFLCQIQVTGSYPLWLLTLAWFFLVKFLGWMPFQYNFKNKEFKNLSLVMQKCNLLWDLDFSVLYIKVRMNWVWFSNSGLVILHSVISKGIVLCTWESEMQSKSILQNALFSFICNSVSGLASQKYRTQL